MWSSKGGHGNGHSAKKPSGENGLVAVGIDKEKGSQNALRWAAENMLSKGQTVILIHVVQRASNAAASLIGGAIVCQANNDSITSESPRKHQLELQTKELFLTFHCYCTRKEIHCLDVILEDTDVAKALTEYVSFAAIENLVLGAPSKHGFIRFKTSSISSSVSKAAPDFCTVCIISKGKVSSIRNASRPAPYASPLLDHIQTLSKTTKPCITPKHKFNLRDRTSFKPRNLHEDSIKSNSLYGSERASISKCSGGFSESDSDLSFISSGRPSTDYASSLALDYNDSSLTSRFSTSSEQSLGSIPFKPRLIDLSNFNDFSSVSDESCRTSFSWSSQNLDEVELEMRRLKLELKQTMDLYSTACKEAITAKQKTTELQNWRAEEEKRLEEAKLAQEAAIAIAEKERARCKAAMEAAEAAKKIAELESLKRANLEMKSLKEAREAQKKLQNLAQEDVRYRRYTIKEIEEATESFASSRKIGEGGYGPVFRCQLDHTAVAVKVLRPDASQGRTQFQQEIDILSCIRHPNMVLLLGACPEYGILVYEYMSNGSLDDRIFRKGNSPVLSWQLRFQIAAEIATGLLFLHQTKPEPLVHRDLKPGNILLDHNFVSKISDVGLARLVPAVAENVTQCCMTSAAGTFCYIDPEYQQTGMLGVKSDVYSLGIVLLQLITAKPPMGLAHHVARSIEKGTFTEILDPAVPDWPVEQAECFAKLALHCAELRRKDRPDLGTTVLPKLVKLREFGEKLNSMASEDRSKAFFNHSDDASMQQVEMSDPQLTNSESFVSQSSASSQAGRE